MPATSPSTVITRRDVLRGLGLSVLAVGAVGLLDACGDDEGGGKDGPVPPGDLELAVSDVERSAPEQAAVATGVASMQALGAGLWRHLSGRDANVAISPFSVAVALGMTLNGAKGATLDEMLGVLDVDSTANANAGYNAVTQYVESLAGTFRQNGEDLEIVLDAANSLFGQQGITWEPPFLDALAASYGAGVQLVDYESNTEAARAAINGWTAERTRDKIPALIPEGVLTDLTRLVLVNALYLKAPWALPFEKDLTEDGDFHLADGSTVSVPMMRSSESVAGHRGDGWSAARLPYAGGALAMTVALPDEPDTLDALVADRLAEVVGATPDLPVDLTMPRWTFRSPSPLKDALTQLGMPTAFTDDADLTGMNADLDLLIQDALHEVFIAVDEEGTEAAAATAVVVGLESAPMPGEPLVLDRPFLFVIHDVEHGTPLFVGRVGDPS